MFTAAIYTVAPAGHSRADRETMVYSQGMESHAALGAGQTRIDLKRHMRQAEARPQGEQTG